MTGGRFFLAVFLWGVSMSASANEATDRKARSMAILQEQAVPTIDHLPLLESEPETIRRTSDAVVERAIALVIVAVKGETRDDQLVQNIIRQFGAEAFFTPDEQAYLNDPDPAEQSHIQFVWRYESAFVMLWALGFYDELPRPDSIVDVGQMVAIFRENGTDGLRKVAQLRPQSDLLDAADLAYRYHWAVIDARVNGLRIPDWMEGGVIYERHYALNWLIGAQDAPWDDVSTDT